MLRMLIPWLYCIAGFVLIMYPLSLVYRVREWETKQRRAQKSIAAGFIIAPIAFVGFQLGLIMIVLGSEALKGNIRL
jgi:hypothetical protein